MEITTPPAPPALDADVAPPTGAHPHAEEVASWMLEGRFFTVDTDGAITMWSPRAAEEFAWSRRDIVKSGFTDTLLAPAERDQHAGRLSALLGGAEEATSFRAEVDAVDATGAGMRVAFAAVRIHVGVGYEFNALLHEVASSSQTARSLDQLKARSESVLALIDDAVHGRHAELAESEDARRLAGALVAFRVIGRSAAPAAPIAGDDDGVVQAAIAAALLEAEESRALAESASARMEEAVAESEQLRADADRSRDALARARDEARADSQRLNAELIEAREGLGAEADRLLSELQGSRERAAAALEQVNADLASARADAELAARALAEARSELEQRVAKLDAAQVRDGALRAELEALSADAAEARARAERTGAELEQARVELDRERATGQSAAAALRDELAALAAELDTVRSQPVPQTGAQAAEPAPAEAEALRRELTRLRHEADGAAERAASDLAEARAQVQQSERELAEVRRHGGRHDAEIQAAAAGAEAMQKELAVLAEQASQARVQAERARAELEGAEAELAHARAARDETAAAGRDESDRLGVELRGARAELDRLQRDLDSAKLEGERTAALAQEEVASSREEIARLKAELKSARAVTPAVEPTVPAAPVAPAPSIAKQRASQYLDYLLTAEVVAEDAMAQEPREPIAIDTLHQMARDIDAMNPYTRRHSERVAGYAAALAEGLGFERPRIEAIRQAALLHDVGKSELLESIVAKDDPLNLEEIDEMARHSQIGRDLLVAAGEPKLAEWVRHIHERFDGGGYPIGLGGTEIPEESRVLHAADALDHMTRPRAYRRNRPVREALAEIAFCAGTRLDPSIATTMIDLVESGRIKVEGPAGPQRIGRPLGGPRGRGI